MVAPIGLPLTQGKPYRYLEWYHGEDAEVFFGRGREVRALYKGVTAADTPPIVLFYGQSGVGKSSLLAAGLLPRLEGSHEVRYARRDQAAGLLGVPGAPVSLPVTIALAPGGIQDDTSTDCQETSRFLMKE